MVTTDPDTSLRSTPGQVGEPALEVRGLTKVFGTGAQATRAVDGLDLTVRPGEVVALLGPNGAGKTTTIKASAGLVIPTAGRICVGGADLRRHRAAAVRHIGAVLEGGRNVYWSLSAWQNLRYFGRLRGLRRREFEAHGQWLLRELELWDRRHQLVGSFSRGMQQKVAIAAALVSDPDLVLLDEPTIGLDVAAARTVKGWVRRLAVEQGKAVVLTTHQLDVAQQLSDRVAVMRDGRIVADRPAAELLDEFEEGRHEIRVPTPASALPLPLRDGAELAAEDADGTRIIVTDPDPDVLYAMLGDLSVCDVPLTSVTPVRPSLEDVFLRLVGGQHP